MAAPPDQEVSVIIPAFNHESYIEQALTSVINQSHDSIEIIVIDDGSSDRTAEVAAGMLRRCSRPHQLVRQLNQGAHQAINKGLALAHGRFLTILNSDDYFHPERLSTLVRAACETNRQLLFTEVLHVDAKGAELPADHPMVRMYRESLEASRWFPTRSFELLRYNFAITSGNLFLHRSVLDRVGPFRALRLCHDWDFLLRSILVEEPEYVAEPLLNYRVHGANTILQGAKVKIIGDQETRQVRSHYLSLADAPANPLAPCARNWGPYWIYFLGNFTNFNDTCGPCRHS